MDRILDLVPPLNRKSLEGASEQMSELMKKTYETQHVNSIPTDAPELLKDKAPTRKYQMRKFKLLGRIARYGEAVYYSAEFEGAPRMLKAYSDAESCVLPWKEVDFLRYLKHPNVLDLLGSFRSGLSFAVFEMCLGNLSHFTTQMNLADKLRVSLQLVDGIDFLHNKSVVHANLSPSVLLIDSSGNLKISEFCKAFALQTGEDSCVTDELLGDPRYLDIEALVKNQYSRKTDVHSCACIIYELDTQWPLLGLKGDKNWNGDGRAFCADALTLGYKVTCRDGLVIRRPINELLDDCIYSKILFSMIEGKVGAREFAVDPSVASIIALLELSAGREAVEPCVPVVAWSAEAVGEMRDDSYIDWMFWNFYFDNEDEEPAPPITRAEIFCPALDSLRILEPFTEEPGLLTSWMNSLEKGDHLAWEFFKKVGKDTHCIQAKTSEGIDKLAASFRNNTNLQGLENPHEISHGVTRLTETARSGSHENGRRRSQMGEFEKPMGDRSLMGAIRQRTSLQSRLLESIHFANKQPLTSEEFCFAKRRCDVQVKQLDCQFTAEKLRVTKFLRFDQDQKTVLYLAQTSQGSFTLKEFCNRKSTCHWKELDFLRQLRHPSIISIYGAFFQAFPYLVLESCYGDLWDYCARMSEAEKLLACIQLVNGVSYLHSMKVVHANLSPKSLQISRNNDVLISDFDHAVSMKDTKVFKSTTFRGCMSFADHAALSRNEYSYKTDLHACACIIFQLDCNRYLQYVREMEQTTDNYATVVEKGYPSGSNDCLDGRVPLLVRVNLSRYHNILREMLNGNCDASSFLKDAAVLKRLSDFSVVSEDKYSCLRQKKFAIQSRKGSWAWFSFTKQRPILVHLDLDFYYDCRDDQNEEEMYRPKTKLGDKILASAATLLDQEGQVEIRRLVSLIL